MPKHRSFSPEPEVAEVAALIGDPTRAAMLTALFDGEEVAASKLAADVCVAANAASAHLAKLLAGGLVSARRSGRRRLFRIAGVEVAHALEALSAIARPPRIVALSQAGRAAELRTARSCYDHLAGRLGVAITEALVARHFIVPTTARRYRLATNGTRFFQALGIDVATVSANSDRERASRRAFARQCLDWSERRPHLAGALGAALRSAFLDHGWVERRSTGRALKLTAAGQGWLRATLSIALEDFPSASTV